MRDVFCSCYSVSALFYACIFSAYACRRCQNKAEILELRKGLIIWVEIYIREGRYKRHLMYFIIQLGKCLSVIKSLSFFVQDSQAIELISPSRLFRRKGLLEDWNYDVQKWTQRLSSTFLLSLKQETLSRWVYVGESVLFMST